jgi:hypothetical protein
MSLILLSDTFQLENLFEIGLRLVTDMNEVGLDESFLWDRAHL